MPGLPFVSTCPRTCPHPKCSGNLAPWRTTLPSPGTPILCQWPTGSPPVPVRTAPKFGPSSKDALDRAGLPQEVKERAFDDRHALMERA